MSIRSPISLVAPWLCLLALGTTAAHASREVDEPIAEEAGPRSTTLTCAGGLTDAQSLACEGVAIIREESRDELDHLARGSARRPDPRPRARRGSRSGRSSPT